MMKFIKKNKKLILAVGLSVGTVVVVKYIAKQNVLSKIPVIGVQAQSVANLL